MGGARTQVGEGAAPAALKDALAAANANRRVFSQQLAKVQAVAAADAGADPAATAAAAAAAGSPAPAGTSPTQAAAAAAGANELVPRADLEIAAPPLRPFVPPPSPPPAPAKGRPAAKRPAFFIPPDPTLPRAVVDIGFPEPAGSRSDADCDARSSFAFACLNVGATVPRQLEGARPDAVLQTRPELRQHGIDIFKATVELRDFRPSTWTNFSGPWLEDYWIHTFARPVVRYWRREAGALVPETRLPAYYVDGVGVDAVRANIEAEHAALAGKIAELGLEASELKLTVDPYDVDLFAPYVPLFISWTSSVVWNGFQPDLPRQLALKLRSLVRQDVQYVTVIQHAEGLYITSIPAMAKLLKNVLVLSAGGKGHVPLPLLMRPLAPLPDRPFEAHSHAISFIGTAERGGVRTSMVSTLKAYDGLLAAEGVNWTISSFKPGDAGWIAAMDDTLYQLAPRGTGRTSFRMYEALQMGLIPIYLWDDVEWLPYRSPPFPAPRPPSIWDDIAFSLHISDFPRFVRDTLPMLAAQPEVHARMRAAVAAAVPRYFTYEAIMHHLHRFFQDPVSAELQCVQRVR